MNQRYVPEPRKCEDKSFLYEQYWGELKSVRSIANMDCVEVAKRKVKEQMRSFGIPIRGSRYRPDNAVPPYSCFYGEGESTTDTSDSKRFDPDYEKEDKTFEWNGKTY